MPLFNAINRQLHKVFETDADPLNRVRAQFLVYGILSSLAILFITLPTFYWHSLHLLFVRSLLVIVFLIALIWILLNTTKWKLVAHCACIVIACLIWSNIFVQIQGVKIISLQWMLLLIVMSYYLLDRKWGIFYSAISVLFMLFYFAIFGKDAMTLASQREVNSFAFAIVFVYNFLLIIYLQHHFFSAFNGTIKQLNIKQAEEKMLNEKLTAAVATIEEAANAKSYFLSTISHELRTPLNGVIGMSEVLLLDNPRQDQAENLNLLKFSANNLLSLINDVLDLHKIESGKIEIESIPFKVYDLLTNIYATFQARVSEKGLDLIFEAPTSLKDITVIGDPTRLTQILVNLTENALKFTAKGYIKLYVAATFEAESCISLAFEVIDTGIGIPKDKHETIFESFTQASTSTTRKYGGTGLGLAIVKNLLELHHSNIRVKSDVGLGTTFSFKLTYQQYIDNSDHLNPTTSATEMDISTLKILVAEDNQMNILLMKKLFAKWDVVPDFAQNGAEAFEAFKSNDYDLILMDIQMPIIDGYEASELIRHYPDREKANVTIVALTASVEQEVRAKIVDAGINDFISKPFDVQQLRAKLEEVAAIKA